MSNNLFQTLPNDATLVLDWRFENYQPFFDDLMQRELTAANLDQWMRDWSALSRLASEASARIEIATTIDTTDQLAEQRFNHFHENVAPHLRTADNVLNTKLVNSGLIPQDFDLPLRKIKTDIALYRDENLPLFTELSKVSLEFNKVSSTQTVDWDGEELTLDQLLPKLQAPDRAIRERAWRLSLERRLQDRAKFNELWGKFMELRGKVAANAGHPNYLSYRWQEMKRFDYTPEDSVTFQEAIEAVVVPAAAKLYEKRKARLGLDRLRPWDLDVDDRSRPPLQPYQTIDELESKGEAIFSQVDSAFGEYFRIMRQHNLLDLNNRKNKANGGYCAELPLSKRPFIFMNAVGIHDDVQTLLHEGGHAFHVFEVANLPYRHQQDVAIEFCEVASMSMELLAAPYLATNAGGYYTEADAARARIEHLESMVKFWAYMAVVDAFQHWVYTHHETASDPANCDAKWGELWDRFMVGIDYSDLEVEKVTGWQRKLHIFDSPLYYIEYGLAQLGAVQVWANALIDQPQAVRAYRRSLALGGKSLPELFGAAGAKFAFDKATLGGAVELIELTLDQLDRV